MMLFRLSVNETAIEVERWDGWSGFDAEHSPATGLWSDLAYPVELPDGAFANGAAVFELQRLRVQNGHMAAAETLLAGDGAAWRAAGALTAASFKVVHGDDLPACLMLLGWPSLAAALAAQPLFESTDGPLQARRRQRETRGLSVLRGSRRIFRPHLHLNAKSEVTR